MEHSVDTQRPSGAVKDLGTGTPTTPQASSPRHLPSHAGEKISDFNAPYHGASAAAPSAPYGYAGEPDMDPHHTPTTGGGKISTYVDLCSLY